MRNRTIISAVAPAGALLFALFFSSLSRSDPLPQLISESVATHPSVRSSLAQTLSAEVEVDTARWQYYPTPSISVEAVDADQDDPGFQGDDNVATARITQPLWTGGRLKAGLNKAKANLNASDAALQEAQQDIALRVVQAYGEWFSAYLQRQAWQASLTTHYGLRDRVQRRVSEGVSGNSDLSLAEGRLESTRADLVAVEAQEEVALARLAQLVARPLTSDQLAGNRASPLTLNFSLQELQALAKSVSPGVNRAYAQLATVDAEIKESKADLWPEVFLRAEHQQGSFNFQNAGSETRIYIGFNSRFGAGLSNLSRVKGFRLRRDSALADIETQRRAIAEQVIADYALATSFDRRVEALKASLETARSVSDSYGRQFLAGRKTWLDVMNSARDLVGTEVQLADAQASQLSVTWRLAIVTQGVQPSLQQSNPL